jgi:hypothetical protein
MGMAMAYAIDLCFSLFFFLTVCIHLSFSLFFFICLCVYLILQVLCHPNIGMMFKRPYLRFLLWAYMNAETNSYKTAEIGMDKRIWEFIEKAAAFTYSIFNKARGRNRESVLERHKERVCVCV